MATAKKKTSAKRTAKPAKKSSAKRTVKYAAKTQSTSPRTSAAMHSAQATTQAGSEWVKKGANEWQRSASEWQKGANEWAKQSAKMYQLPGAGDVAKNATATMQSATENMMKMGSDMMQQMFSQTKKANGAAESFNPSAMMQQYMPSMQQFNANSAQEKMSDFTRSSAEQMAKSMQGCNRALSEAMELARENGEAFVEVTNTAISVSKELGAEYMSYMNKLFSQNAELSKQVLSCRTLNDMFDLASRMMKTNLDGFFSESVKMSEMLFQCATDVSEPLNERMSETTERMTRAMAA